MKSYKVVKPFFKLSEQKDYFEGDIIDLDLDTANDLLLSKMVEEIKTKKK